MPPGSRDGKGERQERQERQPAPSAIGQTTQQPGQDQDVPPSGKDSGHGKGSLVGIWTGLQHYRKLFLAAATAIIVLYLIVTFIMIKTVYSYRIYVVGYAGIFPVRYGIFIVGIMIGALYLICRILEVKKYQSSVQWGTEIVRCIFAGYLGGLLYTVATPECAWESFSFWFTEGGRQLRYGEWKGLISLRLFEWLSMAPGQSLISDLLLFGPLGFFLSFTAKGSSKYKALLTVGLLPIAIGFIQLLFWHFFAVDTLPIIYIGILTGYLAAVGVKALAYLLKK